MGQSCPPLLLPERVAVMSLCPSCVPTRTGGSPQPLPSDAVWVILLDTRSPPPSSFVFPSKSSLPWKTRPLLSCAVLKHPRVDFLPWQEPISSTPSWQAGPPSTAPPPATAKVCCGLGDPHLSPRQRGRKAGLLQLLRCAHVTGALKHSARF